MALKYYKDLIVWQKSIDLASEVYKTMRLMPREELYSLSDQMRRAVVSIPSNIAEGQQRNSAREFKHFLYIAKGYLGELETQIILCEKLEFLTSEQTEPLISLISDIGKLLNGLINSIQ